VPLQIVSPCSNDSLNACSQLDDANLSFIESDDLYRHRPDQSRQAMRLVVVVEGIQNFDCRIIGLVTTLPKAICNRVITSHHTSLYIWIIIVHSIVSSKVAVGVRVARVVGEGRRHGREREKRQSCCKSTEVLSCSTLHCRRQLRRSRDCYLCMKGGV
jgi:hypothetical protein